MKNLKRGLITLFAVIGVFIIASVIGKYMIDLAAIEEMPAHSVKTEVNTELQAVSILDVKDCKRVTAFNIVKDEFVKNVYPEKTVYTHDINDLGNRGTIQIFVDNLNPMDADYDNKAEQLEHLKVESNYKFSVHIPQVLAASIVYVNAQFLSETGAINGYDFIEYMNRPEVTDDHVSETEPLILNITMIAERKYMSPDAPLRNGALITIHYEAEEGKTASVGGDIFIGERVAVDGIVQRNSMALYLVQVIAIAALAMLIFVTVLKKRIDLLPQILYVLGIAGVYTVSVLYDSHTTHPYTLIALGGLFSSVVSVGIALSVNKKHLIIPTRMILSALAITLCPLSLALPLSAGGTEEVVGNIIIILQYIILITASVATVFEILTEEKPKFKLSVFAALVFLAICTFGKAELNFMSSIYIISILLLSITTVTSLLEFVQLEKRNRYLTDNLEAEVERQTESLTHIISERDDLLRYISHDLRKPIIGIRKILPLVTEADEVSAASAMSNVKSKLDTVENALSEISKFSKVTYNSEQSSIISVKKIFKKLEDDLSSDCNANGVHLKIKQTSIEVFAKPDALYSILSNLIFNALEHSGCDTIEISAERHAKKECLISVCDNGGGARNVPTLFTPYNTTYDSESNTGLGLYISKQFALSMGGDLQYMRDGDITRFTVTLPIV